MLRAPQSPEELQSALVAIFPSFAAVLDEPVDSELEPESATFHAVMRDFAWYFAKEAGSFSEKQFQLTAELLTRSVEQVGQLENAVSTCFLEHTRQLKVNRQLAPWFAKARAKRGA
jgi:hypothetical protein